MSRAEELSSGIRSHVEDAERSLTNLVVNTSETIQTGARAAQQALLTVSSDVGAQLKLTSARSRARPHRRRHRRGQLDPDQRPRCADHAGHGLHRGRRPDQVAVRRRRAHALRRGRRHRQRRCSPAPARRRPRWSPLPRMRRARSSRSPPTSSARSRWPARRPPRPSPPAPAKPRARWSPPPTEAASQVKSLAADVERSLSMAGTSTAEADHCRRARSPEHAGHRLRRKPQARSNRSQPTSNAHSSMAGTATAEVDHGRRARSPEHADQRVRRMPPARSSRSPPTSSVRCRSPAPPPPRRSHQARAKRRPR